MVTIDRTILDEVNRPGRIAILSTADRKGKPDAAYSGSVKAISESSVLAVFGNGRTLRNLESNPEAVLLVLRDSPVTFRTSAWRLHLHADEVLKNGELLESERARVAERAGARVAEGLAAVVVFSVDEIRPLVG